MFIIVFVSVSGSFWTLRRILSYIVCRCIVAILCALCRADQTPRVYVAT